MAKNFSSNIVKTFLLFFQYLTVMHMGQGSMNGTDEMNKFSCSILRNVELTYPICFPPTKSYDIGHIAIIVVSVLVRISTICLNSVTVFVYWKVSQVRKKVTHFMIMLLSLSDLGMGMITLALFTILQGKKSLKE